MEIQNTLFKTQEKIETKPKVIQERKKRVVLPEDNTIDNLKWEIRKEKMRLIELQNQDESGWSEFDISIKGKEANMFLVRNHILYYQKIIDKKREKFNHLLVKWKAFIESCCLNNNKEIDKIWFDESSPYDCCIEVRLKNHRCWNSCVSFRFQDGRLKAYDSHFGSGTTFVWFSEIDYNTNPDIEKNKVIEVLSHVFNDECTKSTWEMDSNGHRPINIDDNGWLIE